MSRCVDGEKKGTKDSSTLLAAFPLELKKTYADELQFVQDAKRKFKDAPINLVMTAKAISLNWSCSILSQHSKQAEEPCQTYNKPSKIVKN